MQVLFPETEMAPLLVRPSHLPDSEYFAALCAANPDLRFEQTAQGEILIMAPAGGETGHWNNQISAQLWNWSRQSGTGLSFDSSTGFILPNGAILSPDASWVEARRWAALSREQKKRFLPFCPDFVIELRSPSDRSLDLEKKMQEWIDQGAKLGWLIDPEERTVSIFRPGFPAEILRSALKIAGEGPVQGFVLALDDIWAAL